MNFEIVKRNRIWRYKNNIARPKFQNFQKFHKNFNSMKFESFGDFETFFLEIGKMGKSENRLDKD